MVGEEGRDQDYGTQVIGDRQGQEEGPEREREAGPSNSEGRQGEGDVGRYRHGPALHRPARTPVEGQVDQRRCHHAAQGTQDRKGELPGIGQFPSQDLVFDLQPHDEEEDRHQAILDPLQDGLGDFDVPRLEGEGMLDQAEIACRPGRVGENDRQGGSQGQDDA